MKINKNIIVLATVFSMFFGALGALGADKYIMPVLQFQHVELTSRVENVESFMKMQELYSKKVQLHKLEQEIKQLDDVPQGLLDYKKFLEDEINILLNDNVGDV